MRKMNKVKIKVSRVEGIGRSTILSICAEALEQKGYKVYMEDPRAYHTRIVEWENSPSPPKKGG